MKSIIIVLILFAAYVYATPYGNYGTYGRLESGLARSSGVSECHGVPCPSGSVGCSRRIVTSSDKRDLLTTIKCEDGQGNVLHTATATSENPHPNVEVRSFSYSARRSNFGGSVNRDSGSIPNIDTNTDPEVFRRDDLEDQIETFDK